MTATRDRQSEPPREGPRASSGRPGTSWGERMVAGPARGWPWWGGVLLAFGLAVIGAVIDIALRGEPRQVFEGGYFVGCVGAVCLVRRRSLFTAMVQPPLIFVATVAITTLAAPGSTSGGGHGRLLALADPLIHDFLAMAVTTGVTLAVGVGRLVLQRPPPARRRSGGPPARAAPRSSNGTGHARRGESQASAPRHPGSLSRGTASPRGSAVPERRSARPEQPGTQAQVPPRGQPPGADSRRVTGRAGQPPGSAEARDPRRRPDDRPPPDRRRRRRES